MVTTLLPSGWRVYEEFSHSVWRGYAGNWWLIPAKQGAEAKQLKALRTFKFNDESRRTLVHKNLYDTPGVLTPAQRQSDGLWEQSWLRNADERGYMTDFHVAPEELQQPIPPRRLVVLHNEAYTGACPMLPSPEWAPSQWSIEIFIKGGDGTRWSMGSVYGAPEYARAMHFLIQEHFTDDIEPDTPVDLSAQPFLEPRPDKLSEDPTTWLQGGGSSWSGRRQAASVQPQDGSLSGLSDTPLDAWQPPHVPEGYELLLLPDCMYAVLPYKLPQSVGSGDGNGSDGGGAGAVFEFGGIMRGGHQFRRMRVRYSAQGRASAFESEVYDGRA